MKWILQSHIHFAFSDVVPYLSFCESGILVGSGSICCESRCRIIICTLIRTLNINYFTYYVPRTCVCACACLCVRACVRVCICVHMFVRPCMCVQCRCAYVNGNSHIDRFITRSRHTQTTILTTDFIQAISYTA